MTQLASFIIKNFANSLTILTFIVSLSLIRLTETIFTICPSLAASLGKTSLKVVCKKRAGKVANVRNRSRTVAIEVCLSFSLAVISNFNVFPFPPSKPKLIGDVPMNRQNAAARRKFFFSLLYRALPIDAPNHPASLGDARQTEKKIKSGN